MQNVTGMTEQGALVLAALKARTSNGRVKPDAVPRALVSRVIEAATWAPNHHLTQPWRFVVLTGGARIALGAAMAASLRDRLDDPTTERAEQMLEKEQSKPLRAPVVIAVAALPSPDPRVIEVEDVVAVGAAVQNMLLAAEAFGLAAIWRTGDAAYDPMVKEALGLPPDCHLIAFVYLGWPELSRPRQRSGDGTELTVWLSEDQ